MTDRLPPIAAQRARNASILEHAQRVARAYHANPSIRSHPVVVVPANTRETELLPARLRNQFVTRLRATIQRVFASPVIDGNAVVTAGQAAALHDSSSEDELSVSTLIVGHTCATCRGECCTAGGDHAFLRDDSLVRVRAQRPLLGDEALLALYADHLPPRHYRGSCVYHTTSGCALPRDLRSNLCNRYVCGGVTQLRHALAESDHTTVFIGSADSVHLRRLALVDAREARSIPLT